MAQTVKNLSAIQETWVLSLGWEDPLEKRMATHSSILTGIIPWTEEPGRRRLLLGRKVMTNLDSIFKSRDIILPTKVHLVKVWLFQWSCMDVRVGL